VPEKLPLWAGRTLALTGIILLAFGLRSAVAALSPILTKLSAEVPLSPLVVGFLGMLPPLCFAIFGVLTPLVVKRWGLEASVIVTLSALTVGLAGRGFITSAAALIAMDTLTFAAMGVGNVLLPPLVKRYFSDRIGLVTTVYSVAISLSALIPPLVAVPVADAAGWRVSLGMWAAITAIALVPWIALIVHPRRANIAAVADANPRQFRALLRSPIAWSLIGVFTVSGFNAYAMFAWLPTVLIEAAGSSAAEAGALLALYAAMGLPAGLLVPIIAARFGRIAVLIGFAMLCHIVGYLGILVFPTYVTWLWVLLIGLSLLTFPLSLVLINLRARTHQGSAALSGFMQSIGYLVIAVGPLGVGVLHDISGGWVWPLLLLTASAVPAIVAAPILAKRRFIEDESDVVAR